VNSLLHRATLSGARRAAFIIIIRSEENAGEGAKVIFLTGIH
jgi:hypothetical protein